MVLQVGTGLLCWRKTEVCVAQEVRERVVEDEVGGTMRGIEGLDRTCILC